jgi:hypothetical protein
VSSHPIGWSEVHPRIATRASTCREANEKIEPVAEEILSLAWAGTM